MSVYIGAKDKKGEEKWDKWMHWTLAWGNRDTDTRDSEPDGNENKGDRGWENREDLARGRIPAVMGTQVCWERI